MGILFGMGEDEVLTFVGAFMDASGPDVNYRSAYARGAINTNGGPWQHRFFGKLAAYLAAQPLNDKDFWYAYRWRGGGGFLTGQDGFYMYDADDRPFLRLNGAGAGSSMLQLSSNGGGAWTTYPGSDVGQPATPQQWAFRIKKHPTLGRIEWWINGGLWFTTPNMDTTPHIHGSPSMARHYCPNSNGVCRVSEIMASSADTPLPGLNLRTRVIIGDGSVSQWSGGFARVAELVKDTTTAITAGVGDLDSSFEHADPGALPDGEVVRAIIHSGEYRRADTGAPTKMQPGLVIGGTTYIGPTQYPVDTTPTNIQEVWETSPATTEEFGEAEAADTQLLVRSIA